jgi:glucose/arabinose dehydrogenase
VEHGPRGGDEVNIPRAGRNYGWPVITYGEDYSGAPVGAGVTQRAGMEQPVYYWDPVIAPSGMAFYDADLFPAWKGSLFVGGLASTHLARLTLKGDRVVGEEWLLQDLGERIRDVVVGPDGALYLLTDEGDGAILKLTPK